MNKNEDSRFRETLSQVWEGVFLLADSTQCTYSILSLMTAGSSFHHWGANEDEPEFRMCLCRGDELPNDQWLPSKVHLQKNFRPADGLSVWRCRTHDCPVGKYFAHCKQKIVIVSQWRGKYAEMYIQYFKRLQTSYASFVWMIWYGTRGEAIEGVQTRFSSTRTGLLKIWHI